MSNTMLITGASSGIGKELAKIHAKAGGNLVIVARSKDKLEALKTELEKEYSVQVTVIAKGLSSEQSAQELYKEVKEAGIEIEYLANNAGFGGQGKFHERKWEEDLAMINLNIVVLTALSRLFLPDFVARNSGRILNTSSTASLAPAGPLQAVYFATKHYVTSFSNALTEELKDTNVTVTALLPGATATGFDKAAGLEKSDLFKHAVSAESVAQDGYDGLMAGKMNVVSGLTFSQKLLMAIAPFMPKKMVLGMIYKMQEVPS